jgi:hypothetical protein
MRLRRILRRLQFGLFLGMTAFASEVLCYAQSETYTFVQLAPTLSTARDVNDNGTVVGFRYEDDGWPHAYTWTVPGGLQTLSTDPNVRSRFPAFSSIDDVVNKLQVNRDGIVSATGYPDGFAYGYSQAARWSPSGGLAFLGVLAEGCSSASIAINGSGKVAGSSLTSCMSQLEPFLWSSSTGLQMLSGFSQFAGAGWAAAMNDFDAVVGTASDESCPGGCAFLWRPASGRQVVPRLVGHEDVRYEAMAVNNSNLVVGKFNAGYSNVPGVFLWTEANGTLDLNAPPGYVQTLDVNDAGDIVATITDTTLGPVPYLYRGGIWTDLNTLLPPATQFRLTAVTAINNNGWMVGEGQDAQTLQNECGWVLIPPQNAPPVAANAALTTSVNTIASGTLVATDADGDALTYAIVSAPANGVAVLASGSTGAFTYTPNAGFSGRDAFTFTASDGKSESNLAMISITVTAPPPTPCATDVTASVNVAMSKPSRDRKTGLYTQKVMLANGSKAPITGPLSLALDRVSNNASLLNGNGITNCAAPLGSPFINVQTGGDNVMSPREKAAVTLQFSNATGLDITYTTRVLTGSGTR